MLTKRKEIKINRAKKEDAKDKIPIRNTYKYDFHWRKFWCERSTDDGSCAEEIT